MTTANEMVGRAHRRLNLVAVGETPSTEELAEGVTALNGMMHGWKKRGVDVTHVTLAGTDSIALGDEWDLAIEYLLAERIAGQYQASLGQDERMEAMRAWQNLAAAYLVIDEVVFDNTLTELPSQHDRYGLSYGNNT